MVFSQKTYHMKMLEYVYSSPRMVSKSVKIRLKHTWNVLGNLTLVPNLGVITFQMGKHSFTPVQSLHAQIGFLTKNITSKC